MELASKKDEVLGSVVEVKLPFSFSYLFLECFEELRRIEKTYSRFLDDSELSIANKNIGRWHNTTEEFLFLLASAEKFRKDTDGNFDISIKSVLDDLGYNKNYTFKQHKNQNPDNLLDNHIEIDFKNRRFLLNKEIDFGGLGKGFALDNVAKLLEAKGVDHYYINAGGDIITKRGKDQDPWTILLEHPDDPTVVIGKLELDGRSIAASAPNRRRWGENHHLINVKTKKPAVGVKAIFVIAKTGIEADAYATALFTAGFEDGIILSKKLPVEMLVISSNNKMYKSNGFEVEFFTG